MLKEIKFVLGNELYAISVLKDVLKIENLNNNECEVHCLEYIDYDEDRVVMEVIIDEEPTIFDFENIDIEFIYEKNKRRK